jgi:zinc/manganese transport system substrate-binding protein
MVPKKVGECVVFSNENNYHFDMRQNLSRPLAIFSVGALALFTACGGSSDSTGSTESADSTVTSRPSIVVTYSILGAVVSDVVGEAADVKILMPNGIDPHEWEPSAKDIEALTNADLIVSNGLDLEGNVMEAIEEAESNGVAVFHATDHVEVIEFGAGGHDHAEEETHAEDEVVTAESVVGTEAKAEDEHSDEHGDEHADGDPHFWTSPVEMAAVVLSLGEALSDLGIDVGDRAAMAAERLTNLDQEVSKIVETIPADQRILITGHESLGYFAHQYEFEVVGAVIPSLSSEAEASAGELAELKAVIEAEGVTVIFTELGTSPDVVAALANDAGVDVVELSTHFLPEDGTYASFVLDLASTISGALAS